MPTYYVHSGVTGQDSGGLTGPDVVDVLIGNDANAGTDPAAPLLTLGSAGLQSKAGPFVAYIAGRFRITNPATVYAFYKLAASGVEIRQWPNMAPAQIYGSIPMGLNGGWAASGSGFTKTIATGLTITAWCYDQDRAANQDSVGRRKCWIPVKADAATALAAGGSAQGGVFYNSGTGVVSFGPPTGQTCSVAAGNMTAAANGLEYVPAGRSGLAFDAADTSTPNVGNVVSGIRFHAFCGAGAAPLGCGVYMKNASGCTVEDTFHSDCGIHALSFGSLLLNTATRNNVAVGERESGIHYVFDANGTGNLASGCWSINDKSYVNSLLGADGKYLSRAFAIGGFKVHGGVGYQGCRYVNPQTFEYTQPSGAADLVATYNFDQDAGSYVPVNRNDPYDRPVIIEQTDQTIKAANQSTFFPDQGVTTYASWINCKFDGSKFGALSNGHYFDLRSLHGYWDFWGCEVVAMMNAGRDMDFFATGASSSVMRVNCSVYDNATSGKGAFVYALDYYSNAAASFIDYGTIFGFRSTGTGTLRVCNGDSAAGFDAGAGHGYHDLLLWQVGAATFSPNTHFDTLAEWQSVIDAGTISLAANPFADATGATLGLSATEKARHKLTTPHVAKGVNQAPYSTQYGAYQYTAYSRVDPLARRQLARV